MALSMLMSPPGQPRVLRHPVSTTNDGANGELAIFAHKPGFQMMQYTPVLNTGADWQIYNGPGFTGAIDIPKDVWFHMRLEVVGARAMLYVKDMDKPALVMNDLKSGVQKGLVALYVLTGATYFANFELRETPAAPWERHYPPMPPDTLTRWSLSPAYDASARNLERPLAPQSATAYSGRRLRPNHRALSSSTVIARRRI
jgi:hypothetical protein